MTGNTDSASTSGEAPTRNAVRDWDELLGFAEELADIARRVIVPYFRSGIDVERKGDETPVTAADRKAERAIRQRIAERYPDHGVIGEEFDPTDSASGLTWVIDPIDGTKSFATGKPTFGSLIALMLDDVPRIGVIEIPALAERWVGAPDSPARLNGVPCHARPTVSLAAATVYATTPDMFDRRERRCFDTVSAAARFRCFGGDCYAYGLLAAGHVDIVMEADMAPYDYLALVPVVEAAGGCISDWAGRALGPRSGGRVLASATPTLHRYILDLIGPILPSSDA